MCVMTYQQRQTPCCTNLESACTVFPIDIHTRKQANVTLFSNIYLLHYFAAVESVPVPSLVLTPLLSHVSSEIVVMRHNCSS